MDDRSLRMPTYRLEESFIRFPDNVVNSNKAYGTKRDPIMQPGALRFT